MEDLIKYDITSTYNMEKVCIDETDFIYQDLFASDLNGFVKRCLEVPGGDELLVNFKLDKCKYRKVLSMKKDKHNKDHSVFITLNRLEFKSSISSSVVTGFNLKSDNCNEDLKQFVNYIFTESKENTYPTNIQPSFILNLGIADDVNPSMSIIILFYYIEEFRMIKI